MIDEFKKLLKQSTIYTLANILGKLISFIMLPIYTRCLTPADYGVLELLFLVSTVAGMVFSLNLTSAIPRFYFAMPKEEDRAKLISSCASFSLGLAIVAGLFLMLVRTPITRMISLTQENSGYLVFIFILVALDLCTQVGLMYLRILEKPLSFVGYSMTSFVLGLVLNILFLVVMEMGIKGVMYSLVLSNGLVFLFLQAHVFKQVGLHLNWTMLKPLIRFSLPLVPAAFSIFILNMGDRFLLARFSTTAQIGIYALGYKFGMLLGAFIGGPFLQAWEPKRAELYENNPRFSEIFSRVLVYAVVAMSFGCLLIACPIKEILHLVADPGYAAAAAITPLVALGYMFYNLAEIADVGIFLKKKTFWYPVINTTAAVSNIGINLLLIPRIGIMGAAVATALSFLLMLIITHFISQHYLPLKHDIKRMALAFTLACILYGCSLLVNTSFWYWDGLIKSLIALLYPLALYFLNFLDPSEKALAKKVLGKKIPLFA